MGRTGFGGAADAGVSEREAQVLAAVGEHLTNAEIAARLVISIRTVESHVSSLLRKLGVNDRRALSAIAAERALPVAAGVEPARGAAPLPPALTPFVGRTAERAELGALLAGPGGARLVSAVGPGGVGKTRLALAVAADVSDRFDDGVWYVDLVPVGDPAMLGAAVAGALGLGEQPGRASQDTVLDWVADRRAVLVLDNCEHLLDGVALLTERLLAAGRELVVLATSRARLMLPFERVFPVAGLSAGAGGDDAVALFEERAAAAGASTAPADRARVARVCRSLDGVPLAIELAAARLPAVGLDGLEAGLADRLVLLTGARRVDGRHRSLRSTLDWSCALLDEPARAVLRRVSTFADAFSAADAGAVAGWAPLSPREVGVHLAALADHSLLAPVPGADGTRYRMLETVRQYGAELLEAAGERDETHLRHLRWSGAAGGALLDRPDVDDPSWRAGFDRVADELRAALGWAAKDPEHHGLAYEEATLLAALCLRRGAPGEAQRRYEQAAALVVGGRRSALALRRAAGAAAARLAGNEAIRLHRAAADAALGAGDPAMAAGELAQLAELLNRGPGMIARLPDAVAVRAALEEARGHAGDDPRALARLAVAEAFAVPATGPEGAASTDRALRLARAAGDPLVESAALDRLITVHLARGEVRQALTTARRRVELVRPLPVVAEQGFELSDANVMAAESAIAAGDLVTARRYAEDIRDLPQLREIAHVAVARQIMVTFLAGDWAQTLAAADRFRESWERAGRPHVPTLRRATQTAAGLHELRGETAQRDSWRAIFDALALPGVPEHDRFPTAFLDAMILLHRDRPDEAMRRLVVAPERPTRWYDGIWWPWYAAAWAESAVLAGSAEAADRIVAAWPAAADNPIAAAVLDRAAALLAGDRAAVLATAGPLLAAGCRYQWARSLLLTGGDEGERGRAELADMLAAGR